MRSSLSTVRGYSGLCGGRWCAVVRPEADAWPGVAPAQPDRRAVGTPARGAGEGAVGLEGDRAHAAGHVGHRDHVVAAGGQAGTDVVADGGLDFQLLTLGPHARRFDGLL